MVEGLALIVLSFLFAVAATAAPALAVGGVLAMGKRLDALRLFEKRACSAQPRKQRRLNCDHRLDEEGQGAKEKAQGKHCLRVRSALDLASIWISSRLP